VAVHLTLYSAAAPAVYPQPSYATFDREQGTLKEVVIAKANTGPSSQRYLARLTLMFAD